MSKHERSAASAVKVIPMTNLNSRRLSWLVLVAVLASAGVELRLAAQAAGAQTTTRSAAANRSNPDRWEPTIKKFEDADKLTPPPQNGIVFIGASSIVRWNLPDAFPELGPQAINRGFGGSMAADSTRYAERIVIPYKPRTVVFYAGDNDVEANHTPEQIAADFTAFERKVHAALPATEIIFISIKPSTRRWPWIEQIKGANALVRQYCATNPHLTFMDIVPQMLGADGTPRKELLLEDGLHMTPAGYKIWNDTLRPLLQASHSNR
jgi:lysophospholipase L1-like esterase